METKRKALGKGLEQLFNNEAFNIDEFEKSIVESSSKEDVLQVNLNELRSNPYQPRKVFDQDKLEELTSSIKEYGVIEPIIVKKSIKGYDIVAGERRSIAAKKAGLDTIPAIVRDFTDDEMMSIAILENIQREDLNIIEEAQAYKRLLTEFNLKQDEVAERVSKSRAAVTNSIRLLKLDERVQQMVVEEMLSTGHARALLGVEDPELQFQAANKVYNEKMSVREVEKLVKKIGREKPVKKEKDTQQDAVYRDLEEKMKVSLGTKVTINRKDDNKGKIEIEYYSMEELERLMEIFMR